MMRTESESTGVHPHHFCGERKDDRGLIAALRRAVDFTIGPRARPAQMREKDAGGEARLAVLSAHRNDGAPRRAARVVIDRAQDALLPRLKLERLAHMRAFRREAISLDEGDDIGGARS